MDDQFPNLTGVNLAQRYRLTQEIGRGGFGVVYKGHQINMDRPVAVKILPPQFMAIPDVVERFKREARLASKLRHPNSITIHDYGQQDNLLYIVMELLEGEDLADILYEQQCIEPERILHIARQVLKSLAEAHDLGIIHRDLKPENIFLNKVGDETDFVKVLDFGIAKLAQPTAQSGHRQLTVTGSTVGTPVYMSPEQAAGEEVGIQTDLYALGVIMYELACGHPPFMDDSPVKIMRSHLFQPIPPLSNPALHNTLLERVIFKALEKETHVRYQNAREFLRDVEPAVSQIMSVPQELLKAFSQQQEAFEEDEGEPTVEILLTDEVDLSENSAPGRQKVNTSNYGSANLRSTDQNNVLSDSVPFQRHTNTNQTRQPVHQGASSSSLTNTSGIIPMDMMPPSQHSPNRGRHAGQVSSILTVVDGPDNALADEIILLTRPKTSPQGNPAVPSPRPLSVPAPRPIALQEAAYNNALPPIETPSLSSASQPESLEEWSWGNPDSDDLPRQLDSDRYTQLSSANEVEPQKTKSKKSILVVMLILLIVAGLGIVAAMIMQQA